MAMSVDHDHGVNAIFMWENQLWSDMIKLENLGENSKQKLDMKLLNHKERFNEIEVSRNRKQSRGRVLIRSDNDANGVGNDEIYRI